MRGANDKIHEVKVNLPRLRERELRIAADGTVVETIEDIDLTEAPEPVRRTVESETTAGARLEEFERKTFSRTTVFLAEIDLPAISIWKCPIMVPFPTGSSEIDHSTGTSSRSRSHGKRAQTIPARRILYVVLGGMDDRGPTAGGER